jgi:hypothetical protein
MSIRSFIAIEKDNCFESIYCHNGGSPEHQLPILTGHYATFIEAEALLELGDLSVLGSQLGLKHSFREHGKLPGSDDWCLAYGRDRQDDDTEKLAHKTEDQLLEAASRSWADYIYLFRDGRWYYRGLRQSGDWLEA